MIAVDNIVPGLFFFKPVLNNFVFFCQFLLSLLCSPYGQVFSFSKSLSGTFVIARCKTKVLKKVPASFHCAVTSCAGRERLSLLFPQPGTAASYIEADVRLFLCPNSFHCFTDLCREQHFSHGPTSSAILNAGVKNIPAGRGFAAAAFEDRFQLVAAAPERIRQSSASPIKLP